MESSSVTINYVIFVIITISTIYIDMLFC
uniref:Uncharacterized protein n=1 Tax=Anguilla anguilla TaxID=7936 RepID=A0A0E9RB02_ANGAN